MARKAGIGRAESDILRFIAERQRATASEVGEYLAETKGQTRNTAMTMMERLRAKGYLQRKKVDGVFVYSPMESKATVMESLVSDFVEGVLGGSLTPLVAYLTRRVDVDEKQMEELHKLVEQLEEKGK